jgi:rhamnogalacturonan endolyase
MAMIVSKAGELRIYSTTIPAQDRRVCLMQDPIYRLDVCLQAMGYTQCPMTTKDWVAE